MYTTAPRRPGALAVRYPSAPWQINFPDDLGSGTRSQAWLACLPTMSI
jgi:hypothetical protein